MTFRLFIAVYDKGDLSTGEGARLGTTVYSEPADIFGYEPEAIDVLEVTAEWPPKHSPEADPQ